jgi:hypothetical protein
MRVIEPGLLDLNKLSRYALDSQVHGWRPEERRAVELRHPANHARRGEHGHAAARARLLVSLGGVTAARPVPATFVDHVDHAQVRAAQQYARYLAEGILIEDIGWPTG